MTPPPRGHPSQRGEYGSTRCELATRLSAVPGEGQPVLLWRGSVGGIVANGYWAWNSRPINRLAPDFYLAFNRRQPYWKRLHTQQAKQGRWLLKEGQRKRGGYGT